MTILRHAPVGTTPRAGGRSPAAPAPAGGPATATAEVLAWEQFVARFYPGGGRHDLRAVSAYGRYRQRAGGADAERPLTLAALRVWDSEGGAQAHRHGTEVNGDDRAALVQ